MSIATVIVGMTFAAILVWAIRRSGKDLKNNKCAGCGEKNCPGRK